MIYFFEIVLHEFWIKTHELEMKFWDKIIKNAFIKDTNVYCTYFWRNKEPFEKATY